MGDMEGLIAAYLLDGQGGGRQLDREAVEGWRPGDGVLWVHLDYTSAGARRWLEAQESLDPVIGDALLAEETRPRSFVSHDGLFAVLRGVNLNPGADPGDMVSIRLWLEQGRIITSRKRQLLSVLDLRAALERGEGPADSAEFLWAIADRLLTRIGGVIEEVVGGVDALEEQVLAGDSGELRSELARLRREAIGLRRYLAPQRDAMARLYGERLSWFGESHRGRLRELADTALRQVEEMDAARERALITQEELAGRLAEQLNRRMYVLAMVATLFMPLGFFTGLLGVNVGGIPGANAPWAFGVLCLLLGGLAVVMVILFRRRRWM